MPRLYPVDWLLELVNTLQQTGNFKDDTSWLVTEYLLPNVNKTLFKVEEYQPWLRVMKATLLELQAQYPHLYKELFDQGPRVTQDVLKTAKLADKHGNFSSDSIFTSDPDTLDFAGIFAELNCSKIYSNRADVRNDIQWVTDVEYPTFVAWKVCDPEASKGLSFDNYLIMQSYLRDEVMGVVTIDKRVIAKVCGASATTHWKEGHGLGYVFDSDNIPERRIEIKDSDAHRIIGPSNTNPGAGSANAVFGITSRNSSVVDETGEVTDGFEADTEDNADAPFEENNHAIMPEKNEVDITEETEEFSMTLKGLVIPSQHESSNVIQDASSLSSSFGSSTLSSGASSSVTYAASIRSSTSDSSNSTHTESITLDEYVKTMPEEPSDNEDFQAASSSGDWSGSDTNTLISQ
ncbi:hypothetical protein GQ43DRAFT_429525 [Delitschia confertaspora ATCC 74209]|uniref:Uncharacterized protein n=1 Tax=Delitschia confertaspora ATCC 74209 TaxID=1513339 RepID=A0A9P4JSZ3_9PLEO|nr:hypothetical protein GQ43DRAFT_429525 [Delitschia confertaspora ATCC 74209]